MSIKKVIFSPHLDDACLSVFQLLDSESLVVTVFAGKPKRTFETSWDRTCGFKNSDEAIDMRREENRRAAKFVGFNFQNLNFLDWQYGKRSQKEVVYKALLDIVKRYPKARFYTPIAFGAEIIHPDHKIVGETSCKLLINQELQELFFYADIPYLIGNQKLKWKPIKDGKKKWAAMSIYKSQFENLMQKFPLLNEESLSRECIIPMKDYEELTE